MSHNCSYHAETRRIIGNCGRCARPVYEDDMAEIYCEECDQ
jgi:Zn finger protein HypA/HybF involved in hydrogenase expression